MMTISVIGTTRQGRFGEKPAQIIKQALYPYPEGLVVVPKVGFRRGTDKSWLHAVNN